MIVPVVHNLHNKFTIAKVHYSLDPDKNNKEWITKAKEGMSEAAFQREYEIDYSYFAGKRFFPEFNEYNIAKVEYHGAEVLYRGWDYGFHRPCCIITKLNDRDQWGWMKVILGHDENIKDFGIRVKRFCQSEYPGAKYIDSDDIAGMQKNDKSDVTSRQILNMIGIYPNARRQEINEGVSIIRQKLRMRVDGVPGLIVDPSLTDVIDGFKGGLHFPNTKEGETEKEYYEKEGFYEHIFDSARYIGVEMFTIIGQSQERNNMSVGSLEYQWRDGRPRETLNPNEITQDVGILDLLGDVTGEEMS